MKKINLIFLLIVAVWLIVFGCKNTIAPTTDSEDGNIGGSSTTEKIVKLVTLEYKSPGANTTKPVTISSDYKNGELSLWFCVDHVKAEDFTAEFTVDGKSQPGLSLKTFNEKLSYDDDNAISKNIKLEIPKKYGKLNFTLNIKRENAPPDYSKYILEITSVKYKDNVLEKENDRYQLQVSKGTKIIHSDFQVFGNCRDNVNTSNIIFSNKKIVLKEKNKIAESDLFFILLSDMSHYKGISSSNAKAIVEIKTIE